MKFNPWKNTQMQKKLMKPLEKTQKMNQMPLGEDSNSDSHTFTWVGIVALSRKRPSKYVGLPSNVSWRKEVLALRCPKPEPDKFKNSRAIELNEKVQERQQLNSSFPLFCPDKRFKKCLTEFTNELEFQKKRIRSSLSVLQSTVMVWRCLNYATNYSFRRPTATPKKPSAVFVGSTAI